MSQQQINLFQPMFRREKIVFSTRVTLIITVGFAVLLVLWWALMDLRVDALDRSLASRQQAERELTTRLTELNRSLGVRGRDPVMADQVERLEARVAELQRSQSQLELRVPKSTLPFSTRLEALARRHPDGLWLTDIRIDGERGIKLAGRMLDPGLLPRFLDALGQEPAYGGQTFRTLSIDGAGADRGLGFVLATRDPEPAR
ncbi:MAG: PilN domain-containing protein [Wenzhouxiangellaceae bacterium]|nr:PilN domain-containing protein [Wenzhouxiangellaceae bacterium]